MLVADVPKIRVMPEQLANQIAAGEVVERPASVVKELVENALDAGATRILVETEEGGRELIRVTDNGSGMNAADAALCLARHATSKIGVEADLWRIATLGFRGEALPAIASVSEFSLATREVDAVAGSLVRADGGRIVGAQEAGLPAGTSVEVKRLFFNTPGRRKFLKSAGTELGHVAETITRLALWRPGVYFELRDGGKRVVQAPATESIPERLGALLGRQIMGHLFALEEELPFFKLQGYATNPDFSRGSARHIFPYVNRRYVRDKLLLGAVTGAYTSHLIKGRYPVVVLNVEIDPALVDVNVHPAKAEVRFRRADGVFQNIRGTLSRALNARFVAPDHVGFVERFGRSVSALPENGSAARPEASRSFPVGPPPPHAMSQGEMLPERLPHRPTRLDLEAPREEPEPELGRFAGLAIIGQLADSYIVCESRIGSGGLILIDQHAAHERINFERLRRGALSGSVEVQNLLLPIALELRPVESRALEVVREDLARIGVVVEPFGKDSWRIEAVPAIITDTAARDLVMDGIEHVRETGTAGQPEQRLEAILILAACHGSVRAGQALTMAQMREILRGLDGCERPMTCPHGRPTVREYPLDEIERTFARR